MAEFSEFFGGGSNLALTQTTNFFTSRTWVAPQNGILIMRAMGGGGGGALGSNATGGYSASWGVKVVRVAKGATAVVTIGAGGAGRVSTDGDGGDGGHTTIVVNGVTYQATGGLRGMLSATAIPDVVAAGWGLPANWDFGANGVKPGWVASTGNTGGAGVDILAKGNNATTSASSANSGGGGTGSASVNNIGGGANGTLDALGNAWSSGSPYVDASNGEWGISFYGGAGGPAGVAGANGGGGGSSGSTGFKGGNGGGGSGSANGTGGAGGIGGGGGGSGSGAAAAGNGGPGFAHFKFFADLTV
ncbi:MAG: hypothetical protein KGM60_10860 [Comamonadaceae bacterium]|nr:hypothetical protein [Comamonadaceae bacterium]